MALDQFANFSQSAPGPLAAAPRPAERLSHGRAILAVGLAILVTVIVPLISFGFEAPEGGIVAFFLALALTTYSGLHLVAVSTASRFQPLRTTFWLFVYVWFGIAAGAQVSSAQFPLPGVYTPRDQAFALALVLAGCICCDIAYRLSELSHSSRIQRLADRVASRTVSGRRALALGGVGILLAGVLLSALGGFGNLFASRQEFMAVVASAVGEDNKTGGLLFHTFLRVPIFCSFLLLLFLRVRAPQREIRNSSLLSMATVILGLLTATINNPTHSPRYWVGTILLSSVFVVLMNFRYWFRSLIVVATAVVLLFVFPYLDIFRIDIDPTRYSGLDWRPITDKGDYDCFQQIMNATQYVDENTHTLGRQALGAVFFWIPRKMWPDKPTTSGELVASYHSYFNENVAMPLWGEAYLDAGFAGVLFVFIVYGVLLGILDRVAGAQALGVRRSAAVPIVALSAAYQIFLLRGSLMVAIAYLTPVVGFLFACTTTSTKRSTADSEARP